MKKPSRREAGMASATAVVDEIVSREAGESLKKLKLPSKPH